MKKMRTKRAVSMVMFLPLCLAVVHLLSSSTLAHERPLKTESAQAAEIKGIFTLILYGGSYADDLETVAILDTEGDQYTFDVFAPDFDYSVRKGMPAKEALKEAEKFVSFHPAFWQTQLSKILDTGGNVIGFEIRPLYLPITYGRSDLLDIYYWSKEGGKIKVTIKLIPSVDKFKLPGGAGVGGVGH